MQINKFEFLFDFKFVLDNVLKIGLDQPVRRSDQLDREPTTKSVKFKG